MLVDQQTYDRLPRSVFDRDPVLSFERKRLAPAAAEPAPDFVFPVRRVGDELEDIVPAGRRSPHGLRRRYAADRAPQRRTMPRPGVEGFIDQIEHRAELDA